MGWSQNPELSKTDRNLNCGTSISFTAFLYSCRWRFAPANNSGRGILRTTAERESANKLRTSSRNIFAISSDTTGKIWKRKKIRKKMITRNNQDPLTTSGQHAQTRLLTTRVHFCGDRQETQQKKIRVAIRYSAQILFSISLLSSFYAEKVRHKWVVVERVGVIHEPLNLPLTR